MCRESRHRDATRRLLARGMSRMVSIGRIETGVSGTSGTPSRLETQDPKS